MTSTVLAQSLPVPAVRDWLPWAIFAGLILLLAIYFVGAEQGANCSGRADDPREGRR